MIPDNCDVTDSRLNPLSSFTSELSLCLFLQAVETNLASKDSHWVYANEVRPDTNTHKRRGKLTLAVPFKLPFVSRLFSFFVQRLGKMSFYSVFHHCLHLMGFVHIIFS